uniref:COMM domain-containing protein n=1 Tax=Clastoptera arizonana TaxID=38151 RepID=A0A1B6EFT5_9HEMI
MAIPAGLFNITPSLQRGVDVINKVDTKKLVLVLKRIVQSIQACSDEYKPFNDDEEEKLLCTLNIDQTELSLLLDTSTLILTQAAYCVTKPQVFQEQLLNSLKLEEEKAQAFVHIWSNHAQGVVSNLRQKSIHPIQLESVNWKLNITTADDVHGQQLEPRAMIGLKLKHDGDKCSTTILDLNEEGLVTLYNTLENIQAELDSLR